MFIQQAAIISLHIHEKNQLTKLIVKQLSSVAFIWRMPNSQKVYSISNNLQSFLKTQAVTS